MARELQKIIVMGLGYIGLPTASMLATKGHQVLGVDVNAQAVDIINSGRIHIVEPDLDILVKSAVNSGNLKASLTPEEGDTFILAVPTPFKEVDGNPKAPDLAYIETATRAIAPYLREDNLVILESTSPVGTTDLIERIVREALPDYSALYGASTCSSTAGGAPLSPLRNVNAFELLAPVQAASYVTSEGLTALMSAAQSDPVLRPMSIADATYCMERFNA